MCPRLTGALFVGVPSTSWRPTTRMLSRTNVFNAFLSTVLQPVYEYAAASTSRLQPDAYYYVSNHCYFHTRLCTPTFTDSALSHHDYLLHRTLCSSTPPVILEAFNRGRNDVGITRIYQNGNDIPDSYQRLLTELTYRTLKTDRSQATQHKEYLVHISLTRHACSRHIPLNGHIGWWLDRGTALRYHNLSSQINHS